ncbi:hypothetical protein D3C80_1766470 [compost metagenome]
MMHADVAARERAVGKELRGSNGALQAVGIHVNAVSSRATFLRQNARLLEPRVEIVAHIHFQHAALGGQQATWRIPLWPGFRRGLGQHATVVRQRCTQVMAAHYQHLFQLITVVLGKGGAAKQQRQAK